MASTTSPGTTTPDTTAPDTVDVGTTVVATATPRDAGGSEPSRHLFAAPRRFSLLVLALTAAVVVIFVAGISIGPVQVPLGTVWRVVASKAGLGSPSVSAVDEHIVWDIRVPRVLLGALVGAGLAVCGVVVQAVVRNPLGDPYLLGIAPGASLGAVTVIVLGSTAVGGLGRSGAAFVGALASFALTLVLARSGGMWHPTRLVLAGVAIGYALSSATFFLQVIATPSQVQRALFWSLGSVASARWDHLPILAAVTGAGVLVLLALADRIDALVLGRATAASLGVDVGRLQVVLATIASLITGCAVAFAGGIGFVGLVVPHAARILVGAGHRRVLLTSMLIGAPFLVLVDIAARMVRQPAELPIGVLTAAIGAPTFLFLLRSRGTGTSGGE